MIDSWWLYLWVFPVGLAVGSFLNVCVYRVPAGQSVISPRSQCPACHTPIAWFDNIPLLSYLWLGRRCRHCQTSISIRYPVIELMNGLGYVGVAATFGYTLAAGGVVEEGLESSGGVEVAGGVGEEGLVSSGGVVDAEGVVLEGTVSSGGVRASCRDYL